MKLRCGHESMDSWAEDAETRLPYCMECGWDSLKELTVQVTDWHEREFGSEPINEALAYKMLEEAGELHRTIMADLVPLGYTDDTANECADVLIVLCALAGRNGIDLMAEARKKLAVVRQRNQRERDRERGIPA